MKKVAIIGAGASGLMCAIICAKHSLRVDLFEQNEKCAKKILVSGNGRCNITNTHSGVHDFFSDNPSFVEFVLKNFTFEAFERFTSEIGLLLDVKEDGRVYPLSNEAKSVALILQDYAKSLGVVFHTATKISSVQHNNKRFTLHTHEKSFTNYSHLVVATGSQAASHLGGNDDGHMFAKSFGHNIVATYPSLVQLHLNSSIHSKISGAKVDGEITLLLNAKKELSSKGDILFTNYGVSGFAVLDISQRASVALMNYECVDIIINLLPKFSSQKLSSHLQNLAKTLPKLTLLDALAGLIPIKIATVLLQSISIAPQTQLKDIHTKTAKKIANTLQNWKFEVTDTHGFRHAEVSGGGVDTTEIDPKSMQSLKQKNLYFCGEVLDVVGRRGGFNFAFAWASGYTAAKSIVNS